MTFTGNSQIVSPEGEYILQMDKQTEYHQTIEIDPNLALDKNITPFNNIFKDRRTEFYS